MEQNQPSDNAKQPSFIPAGWIGGFSDKPPVQPYPNDKLLSSLVPLQRNMDNIPKITRMLRAKWPEFSWEQTPGDTGSRLYQMFAPDISRLGYGNDGRVWSIICPQQGVYFQSIGVTMNIEVTVTGNRGWINENAPQAELFAADLTIKPTIWFSSDPDEGYFWGLLQELDKIWNNKLPLSKLKGIKLNASNWNSSDEKIQVRMGERPDYAYPARAKHWDQYAWAVANLAVKIGAIDLTGDANVDYFNSWVMTIFNLASGNLLLKDNILTWNLWAGSPELVNQAEWQNHAVYWRDSIDVHHRPPVGEGTGITDIKGTQFDGEAAALKKIGKFGEWILEKLKDKDV
jgi:hypothetical protein